MKRIVLSLFALGTLVGAWAQNDERVLLTINDQPVTAGEFLYIYQKNNQETTVEKKTPDEYLEMFINFKLKVTEAEAQQLDTTAAFRKELKGYRAQAIPKYMQDQEAIDSLVQMSYNRMRMMRRAAHIAIECPLAADDSTRQAAEDKINLIRERVTVGLPVTKGKGRKAVTTCTPEDFFEVAVAESMDPSVKDNRGELGWIIPFRYVYSFEDAVYNTTVGEVSQVFRSPYGFHIALVEEEIPTEEVKAAHIMKMVPGESAEREAQAKTEIDSIYNLLLAGADFAATAREASDDKGSAMRGGDLGWFGKGVMVPAFEQAVFALQPGQTSLPFRSRFGWHIARVEDRRPMQPLDSIRNQILKQVQRDERMKEADKAFIQKTRAYYGLNTMTDNEVREYADAHLEERYPELANLVREYHDGILLFDISLKNVWDKAAKDEEGLAAYFKAHKKDFTWAAPRYKGYIIYAANETAAKQARNIIRSANPDSIRSYIDHRVNNDSVKFVRVEHGLWQQGQNAAVDYYGLKVKGATYTPDEKMPIVMAVGKKLKNPEVYTDERSKVTSAYQDELERQWVEQLRAKYTVTIIPEVWEDIKGQK